MPLQMCSPTDTLAGDSLSYRWLVTINPSSLDRDDAVDDTALFIVIDRPTSPDFSFQTTTTPPSPTCSAPAMSSPTIDPLSPVSVLSRSLSVQSCSSATSSRSLLFHGGRRSGAPNNTSSARKGFVGCMARKVVEVCLWVVMKVRKSNSTSTSGCGSMRKKEKKGGGDGGNFHYYCNNSCSSSRSGRRRSRTGEREMFPAMDYCCRPKRPTGATVDVAVERSIHDAVLHCKQSVGKVE